MYHPIPHEWLFSASLVKVKFTDAQGDIKTGQGTGFWILTNEKTFVFVTNRHVVDLAYGNPKYSGYGYKICELEITSFDSKGMPKVCLVKEPVIRIHQKDSVDIALIADPSRTVTEAMQHVARAVPTNVLADEQFINTSLEWGAQVTFSSYQPWRDKETELPIVRTGIVSSNPRATHTISGIDRKSVLLLEALSFSGSSGSPVYANARGIQTSGPITGGNFREAKVVGIIAGHIRNSGEGDTEFVGNLHTGLSYCHRSDLLLRMLSCDSSEPTNTLE